MTTLYRPVKITSAEQAEALPEGTIITHAENYPQEKFSGLWGREGNSSASLAEEEGWTALVPIEAEEEYGGTCPCGIAGHVVAGAPEEEATHRCYVTPWTPTEEA